MYKVLVIVRTLVVFLAQERKQGVNVISRICDPNMTLRYLVGIFICGKPFEAKLLRCMYNPMYRVFRIGANKKMATC